jgi:RecB family endonuclease NucS
MKFQEFISSVEEALQKGELVSFFCHCAITYSGRAESYLDYGDRLIIIKQDRTLLIHQPDGGMPINYLKAPASTEFILDKSEEEPLVLLEARSGFDEIDCEIKEIYDLYSRKLIDGLKQELSGSEAEMSDHIRDNPEIISKDFIPLSREEHTKYGFIDVFGHTGDGTLLIVECKRYTAGLSGATQLRRYVEKMKSLKGVDNVTGVMAAPAITSNALAMLKDWGLDFVRVEPPKRHVRKNKRQKKIESFF